MDLSDWLIWGGIVGLWFIVIGGVLVLWVNVPRATILGRFVAMVYLFVWLILGTIFVTAVPSTCQALHPLAWNVSAVYVITRYIGIIVVGWKFVVPFDEDD